MELVKRYKIKGSNLRFGRGWEKLQEIWDTVFAKKDVDKLLHQPNEHLFVVNVDRNKVKEYAAKGMHIDSAPHAPRTKNGEDIISIHTHPIGSFDIPGTDIKLSCSDFPSLTDLNSLLDATLYYSEKYQKYTPSIDYILGWGNYLVRSKRLISCRFTKDIIDYLLSKEERVQEFRENLATAFYIVLDDPDRRVHFSDEMWAELNKNLPYGFNVLKLTILEDNPRFA
jgi:proteasome lid subunit RPN8/RPN11